MKPGILRNLRFGNLLFYRINGSLLPVSSLSFESQYTVNRCEQRIIAAASNVHAGMNLRSALSVKDVSSFYKLSVGSLRAKSLGLGISAVLRGTNTLFMSKKLKVQL